MQTHLVCAYANWTMHETHCDIEDPLSSILFHMYEHCHLNYMYCLFLTLAGLFLWKMECFKYFQENIQITLNVIVLSLNCHRLMMNDADSTRVEPRTVTSVTSLKHTARVVGV